MQERRTTIRSACARRAQYCPSDEPIPRDGRTTDISEHGLGLLTRDTPRLGERIAVSFSLPGDDDSFTASGEVRWAEPPSDGRGFSRVGLQWLPIEETARYRLHAFLQSPVTVPSGAGRARTARPESWLPRVALRVSVVFGALTLLAFGLAVASLEQTNRLLDVAVQQRNAIIGQLELQSAQLQTQLRNTQRDLSLATVDATQMDLQGRAMREEIARLQAEGQRFQAAYARVQDQRVDLIGQVASLETERSELLRRLTSLPELRLAVREAIEARTRADQASRLARLKARRDAEAWLTGNRGFLVLDGASTFPRPALSVRVHDPQPVPAPTAPAE
jgi:hypothetical protein